MVYLMRSTIAIVHTICRWRSQRCHCRGAMCTARISTLEGSHGAACPDPRNLYQIGKSSSIRTSYTSNGDQHLYTTNGSPSDTTLMDRLGVPHKLRCFGFGSCGRAAEQSFAHLQAGHLLWLPGLLLQCSEVSVRSVQFHGWFMRSQSNGSHGWSSEKVQQHYVMASTHLSDVSFIRWECAVKALI
jgi:hypothetical protein